MAEDSTHQNVQNILDEIDSLDRSDGDGNLDDDTGMEPIWRTSSERDDVNNGKRATKVTFGDNQHHLYEDFLNENDDDLEIETARPNSSSIKQQSVTPTSSPIIKQPQSIRQQSNGESNQQEFKNVTPRTNNDSQNIDRRAKPVQPEIRPRKPRMVIQEDEDSYETTNGISNIRQTNDNSALRQPQVNVFKQEFNQTEQRQPTMKQQQINGKLSLSNDEYEQYDTSRQQRLNGHSNHHDEPRQSRTNNQEQYEQRQPRPRINQDDSRAQRVSYEEQEEQRPSRQRVTYDEQDQPRQSRQRVSNQEQDQPRQSRPRVSQQEQDDSRQSRQRVSHQEQDDQRHRITDEEPRQSRMRVNQPKIVQNNQEEYVIENTNDDMELRIEDNTNDDMELRMSNDYSSRDGQFDDQEDEDEYEPPQRQDIRRAPSRQEDSRQVSNLTEGSEQPSKQSEKIKRTVINVDDNKSNNGDSNGVEKTADGKVIAKRDGNGKLPAKLQKAQDAYNKMLEMQAKQTESAKKAGGGRTARAPPKKGVVVEKTRIPGQGRGQRVVSDNKFISFPKTRDPIPKVYPSEHKNTNNIPLDKKEIAEEDVAEEVVQKQSANMIRVAQRSANTGQPVQRNTMPPKIAKLVQEEVRQQAMNGAKTMNEVMKLRYATNIDPNMDPNKYTMAELRSMHAERRNDQFKKREAEKLNSHVDLVKKINDDPDKTPMQKSRALHSMNVGVRQPIKMKVARGGDDGSHD